MTSNVIVPQAMFSISSKHKQHLVGDECSYLWPFIGDSCSVYDVYDILIFWGNLQKRSKTKMLLWLAVLILLNYSETRN